MHIYLRPPLTTHHLISASSITRHQISRPPIRKFHSSPSHRKSPQLPPRPSLPDSELKHTYLKGSGPGGQKINKTSSAVQLTHIPTGVVVKSQATRSQRQNHDIARRILAEKIEFMQKGGESRVAKKIELKVKRKRGAGKKARRKYRRLEAEKGKEEEEEEEGEVDQIEGGGGIEGNREGGEK